MFSSYELSKKGYTCPDLLSNCCVCDCSSLKCQQCIQRYCCCCCITLFNGGNNKTYPHIEYGKIESHNNGKDESNDVDYDYTSKGESVASVPCQKIFKYSHMGVPRQYSIHPQLDNGDGQLVLQQPSLGGYSELSDSATVSSQSSSPYEEVTSKDLPLDYSYGGSMDDIGAEIGFVDMSKSSRYMESNPPYAAHQLAIESHSVPTIAQPRSASPFLYVPPLVDPGAKLRKRSLQLTFPTPEHSCVHFSLYYHESNQKLVVHLKEASRLPTSRPEESSNPFTEVYLLPNKGVVHKSHVETKTHSPVFDETFKFTELDSHDIKKQTLVMRMYINERSHFIGGVLYPLESAAMNGDLVKVPISEFDEEESLRGICCGDILLSLCYHSEAKTVEMVVIEINNLKKSDFIGLSNPYVKVNMMLQEQRLLKWKTTIKKNTLMPVFYESASFDTTTVDINNIHFDVIVMDHDRVGRNNVLGSVKLGSKVGLVSGEKQWKQILENPNRSLSTWHCIKPIQKGNSRQRTPRSSSCVSVGH